MTYTPVANGDPVVGSNVQQLIDGVTGQRYEVHTFKSTSTSQYAVTVQSDDPTNGYIFRALDSDDNLIFAITQDGFTGSSANEAGVYNVLDAAYGAKADVRTWQSYGNVTSGSTTLTLMAPATGFVSTDVGKVLCVTNGSSSVVTTVQSYVNATSVNMATVCTFTSSTAQVLCGTDSTAAFRAAWTAAEAAHGGTVYIPAGTYFAGNLNWSNAGGIRVQGEPGINTADSGSEHVAATHRGTHILALPGATGTWIDFCGNTGSGIEGIVFGRSDQSNWAALNVGLLMLAKSGKECVENYLNDGWITGSYTRASCYVGSVNQSDATRWRFYNYSSYTGATCLSLTASNWADVTSANLTVNSVSSWNETRSWVFERCQFHQVLSSQSADAARVQVYSILLDGVWDVSFKDCDITNTNACVRWVDGDTTTTTRLSRLITFDHCNFEHPDQTPSSGGLAQYALPLYVVRADTNAAMQDWKFDSCRARLHTPNGTAYGTGSTALTTVTTVGAWIAETGTANTAASFVRTSILRPWNYNSATANYLLGMFSSSNTSVTPVRFQDCVFEFAGLSSVMRGVADGACFWGRPGTLTFDSYANGAIEGATTRPTMKNGVQVDTAIYSASGGALLTTTGPNLVGNAPFVAMTHTSGSPVANAVYAQSPNKAYVAFTASSSPTINASYGVSTVTYSATGDFTVVWLTAFTNTNFIPQVSVQSTLPVFSVVHSNPTATSTRILAFNSAGTAVNPSQFYVTVMGLQ